MCVCVSFSTVDALILFFLCGHTFKTYGLIKSDFNGIKMHNFILH